VVKKRKARRRTNPESGWEGAIGIMRRSARKVRSERPRESGDFTLHWWPLLLVLALALAYRGLYLAEGSSHPDFGLVFMDQEYHVEWARSLASGQWTPPYDELRSGAYFRAPLYPHFLAGVLALFGNSLWAARIVQILIGSLSCVLASALATKCFGSRTGVVTGILCAFYWVFAYFDARLLLPVLLVFFILLAMLLTFLAVERRSPSLIALAGLTFGLYSITRPNILVFFPFLFWWSWRAFRPEKRGRAALFTGLLVLGCVLPPLLVTVRNRVVADDWVVVASQGGVNFYIGNNAQSNGMEAVVPGTRQSWWGGFEDTRRIAEEAAGRSLKDSEVSDYWFRRAWTEIRANPGRWLRLTGRKALAFFGDPELPNNEPYEAQRSQYRTLSLVPLGFAVFFGLFLVSLPEMIRRVRTAAGNDTRDRFVSLILQFVVVYSLSVIAFFVTGRYRVPVVPFLVMGAALTLVRIFERLRAGRVWAALPSLVTAVCLIAVLRIDVLDVRAATHGFAELTEAQNLLARGDVDGAIRRLDDIRNRRSVRAREVYQSLIRAYSQRNGPGDREAILRVAEEAARAYPDEPEFLWFVAVGAVDAQQWERAAPAVEHYLLKKPEDVRGIYLGFVTALARGRRHEAEAYLRRAEAVDSGHALVASMREKLAASASSPESGEPRQQKP
jgi:4-amino-4-deoxy-L-arabinose transferase-like glycosyltransferase